MPPSPLRKLLRDVTLNQSASFRHELVELEGENGAKVSIEIRQPTIELRGKVLAAATTKDGKFDTNALLLNALVYCAFIPGTGERVFDAADIAALSQYPAGGWPDKFGQIALKLMNEGSDAPNESAATQNSSPVTGSPKSSE